MFILNKVEFIFCYLINITFLIIFRSYQHLEKRKEELTEAFNKANNKDIQLIETMTQTNTTRKKTKELILEEKKRLENLNEVPEKTKAVSVYNKTVLI